MVTSHSLDQQDCLAIIFVKSDPQLSPVSRVFSLSVEVVYFVVRDLLQPVQVPPPEGQQLLGAESEPGRDARTPGLQIPQKLLEMDQSERRNSYTVLTNQKPSSHINIHEKDLNFLPFRGL